MEAEKNMIKGQEGEAFVIREVGKVANYLGKTIRCFNHVILDFDSVYGSRTAELDHIIICGDKILIGETKNANYVSTEYSEIPWNLMNGKTTDNPIVQNHYHKQIFCSLFNISRENVITVECLLEYEKCRYRTQFPNDYVLGHDNLFDALCLLLANSKETDLYDELCKELEIIESSSIGREEEHKENIDEVSEIEEKTRTRDKHYRFKRTDIVKCPNCDGNLVFRYKPWVKIELGNKNNTKNIALGCSNFPITGCNVFIKPRKDAGTGFDDIKEIHIEERMGWTMEERHVDTILDKYYALEREVVALKKLLNVESEKVSKRDNQIDSMNKDMQDLRNEIGEFERRIQKAEDECKAYRRIVGRIYVKE